MFKTLRWTYISWPVRILFVITVGALVFQIGHFSEHFIQVGAWIFGNQTSPYMSPAGMWLMDTLGQFFFPLAEVAKQKYLGFELLHLFGNAIFMIGIIGTYYFIRIREIFWALIIEGYHLYEHISLTASAIYIGKSIGFSTLFGLAMSPWTSVAYRVWWHFLLNLIPTALVILGLYIAYQATNNKGKI
jgi:hypothetical protein